MNEACMPSYGFVCCWHAGVLKKYASDKHPIHEITEYKYPAMKLAHGDFSLLHS